MFNYLKRLIDPLRDIPPFTFSSVPGETLAEFDVRFAEEEKAHFAKYGITL